MVNVEDRSLHTSPPLMEEVDEDKKLVGISGIRPHMFEPLKAKRVADNVGDVVAN